MQITPQNVGRLAPAWIFHTGEHRPAGPKGSSFEDTPILADGKLLVCTPTDRVFALDPLTGRALWAFDPKLAAGLKPGSDFLCRGVAVWRDTAASPDADCRARVVLATLDLRVIELDLTTGRPCEGFGEHGTVRLSPDPPPRYPGAVTFDSPPAVVGDTLVLGTALDDMTEARASGSAVCGLDAAPGCCAGGSTRHLRPPRGRSSRAAAMSGRRSRRTRRRAGCSCRPPRRVLRSGAANGPATTALRRRSWR